MFEAPEIIKNIPDIKQIYDINEYQGDALDHAVEQIDDDMNLDEMDESTTSRWETMLKITPAESDTLDIRRFRIKTKITDKMPYTYRALEKKLDYICGAGAYSIVIDRKSKYLNVKIALSSKKKIDEITKMLDEMVPLDMTFEAEVLYNTHRKLSEYPHCVLAQFTHTELYSEELKKDLVTDITALEAKPVETIEGYKIRQMGEFGFRKET